MRRYLVLVLAALAFLIAAPSAFATHIIFDPPSGSGPPTGTNCTISGSGGLNNYTPCNVSKLNVAYSVSFVGCSTLTGLDPAVADGWCLYMTNVSGTTLGKFTFQFTVPSGGSTDGTDLLTCGSRPTGFATDNCQDGLSVNPNDVLDVSFFASLPNNKNFYLITDFENSPGSANVTVSVPEPGALGLFGLGLLAIGGGLVLQRCRRDNDAA